MNALLSAESDDSDKVSQAVHECRRMGIKILPPSINESGIDFTISKDLDSLEGKAIRFGLSAIKNVGGVAIQAILDARKIEEFKSLSDFINRVDGRKVNKKVLESLIKVGAMEGFAKRTALLLAVDVIKSKLSKPKENNGQSGLFAAEDIDAVSAFVSDSSVIDNSLDEFSEEEMENFERNLLGFSISAKPISEILDPMQSEITHKISEIDPNELKGKIVKIGVVIREVRVITTKKGNLEMAFVKGEDTTGIVDLVIFPKIYQNTKNLLVDGKAVLISGKADQRDEEISFLVESLEEFKPDGRPLIHIPAGISKDKLMELKSIFEENAGDDEVVLLFDETQKKVVPKQKIKWSENLEQKILQSLFLS